MIQNVLFYGNCQTCALKDVIIFSNQYRVISVSCFLNNLDKNNFTSIIKNSDIIITQPISDNYRDCNYLCTSYILDTVSEKKIKPQIIIMDSCYFDFYYPDLQYYFHHDELLRSPMDYHHGKLIDYFKQGKSPNEFIDEVVKNDTLYTSHDLHERAMNSLHELEKRLLDSVKLYTTVFPTIKIVSIVDYVKENYLKHLLFYSMNHPTKYVLQYIAKEIIAYLNDNTLVINHSIDPLGSNAKCILYNSVRCIVHFDTENDLPKFPNDITSSDINHFVNSYYETYTQVSLK